MRAVVGCAAALVCLLLVAIVGARVLYDGRVLPRTQVAGIALGGADGSEARRRLASALDAGPPVTVTASAGRWSLAPGEAGYSPDIDRTVSRALSAGRRGPLGGVWATLRSLAFGGSVAVAGTVDADRLRDTTDRLASRVERRPFPGGLTIDPAALTVDVRPPRPGVVVDQERLGRRLAAAFARRSGARVRLDLRRRPVASRAKVEAVARAAERYLRTPLELTGAGEPLAVAPPDLAKVLALSSSDGGRRVELGAYRRRLAGLVDGLAARRDRRARDPRIQAPARATVLDAKGDVTWRPRRVGVSVRPGRSGRAVRRRELTDLIDAAVRAGRHRVRLPARRVSPSLSRSSARRVDFLIGTFTTRYEPGQPRVRNIRRIAGAVDRTVVAPGEQFSLNATSGPRTSAKGYVKAPFIADGEIVPSVGGGVSQFSTTLYNAAFFAGLRLDAHQPHSFYIDRYPPGREATLNFPDIDLRWTNDTDAPVLVRASTDASSVTVSLYGARTGRRVSADTGPRRPVPGGAFVITVTRVLRYRGGRVVRQGYETRYDTPPAS